MATCDFEFRISLYYGAYFHVNLHDCCLPDKLYVLSIIVPLMYDLLFKIDHRYIYRCVYLFPYVCVIVTNSIFQKIYFSFFFVNMKKILENSFFFLGSLLIGLVLETFFSEIIYYIKLEIMIYEIEIYN